MNTPQKAPCLQALSVALQHPAVAADQQIICTLLQVSKAMRPVVQQSAAGLTDVQYDKYMFTHEVSTCCSSVSSFARWLAKHAGLPRTVEVCCHPDPDEGSHDEDLVQAMQQLLEFALQCAAGNNALGAGAPLRLQSYTSTVPPTAGLIAALPAATLTSIDMKVCGSNWSAPLSKLTSLRKLRLSMICNWTTRQHQPQLLNETADVCLREIGRLEQLTQLIIKEVPLDADMQLLPAQLQQLELQYINHHGVGWDYVWKPVVLQHVTGLQSLKLKRYKVTADSSLPTTLQSLHLDAGWDSGVWTSLSSLQHVTSVSLCKSFVTGAHLIVLKQLPQLKDLSLSLEWANNREANVREVCVAWHNLPLRNLSVATHELSVSSLQLLLQNVSAVTQLTSLVIDVQYIVQDAGADQQPSQLVMCKRLVPLTGLRSLGLHVGESSMFNKRDARHLSALVQLTKLDLALETSGPYLDAATVCLLAVTLTRLKALAINRRHEESEGSGNMYQTCIRVSMLPAIGRLTGLSSLRLGPLSSQTAQEGLEFMTELSRLTELQGFEAAGGQILEDFWSIVDPQALRFSLHAQQV